MMSKRIVIVKALFICVTSQYYASKGSVWTDLAYDSSYGVNRRNVPVNRRYVPERTGHYTDTDQLDDYIDEVEDYVDDVEDLATERIQNITREYTQNETTAPAVSSSKPSQGLGTT